MDMTCIDSEEIKNRVEIVMRQTDYEKEVAEQKLKKHNYDTTACIKEYLGIEIRSFLLKRNCLKKRNPI